MIRSHFGLTANPFDSAVTELLPHQQAVFDVLCVHARQGGLCLLMGEPGTGKSVLKQALRDHDPKKLITPVLNRTLHTYSSSLQILCEAFGVEAKARDTYREKALIEVAFKLNTEGKLLMPIIDDAHLMELEGLRKLRLLFEDFPRNHCLLLVAQPPMLDKLRLLVNQDIRSRITYSHVMKPLLAEELKAYIFRELDRVQLGHNCFSEEAMELILRSSEGLLRRCRNLCVSAMLEAVRDSVKCIDLDQVNRVLMQPHWRSERDLSTR
jgi:type II secretory pathway predicted ATPase ExeA